MPEACLLEQKSCFSDYLVNRIWKNRITGSVSAESIKDKKLCQLFWEVHLIEENCFLRH
jgi:hypothetical protein